MIDLQILMPAHNEESYIKKILQDIDGVLKKLKISYSFIICEDGSTDQTLSIIKNLEKKLKLDILSKKKNKDIQMQL